MTTTKIAHRPLAILALPKTVPALVTYAQNIVTAMTGNAYFGTPNPPLATITTSTDDLLTAETATLSRMKGAVAIRNEKRAALVAQLQELRAYVQSIADKTPENATSIIQSAHIPVKKVPARKPRTFEALPGTVSGSVRLVAASAGARSSYEWQYSLDGGKTWVLAPVTVQARTTVTGLTPGATVLFRYRPVTKKGEGDFSQTASLIVQ